MSLPAAAITTKCESGPVSQPLTANTVDRARVLIEDYLYLQNPDFDFRLGLPEYVFDSEPVSNILKLALKDGRKAQFDREKCTLNNRKKGKGGLC
jgi:hypothetical protein